MASTHQNQHCTENIKAIGRLGSPDYRSQHVLPDMLSPAHRRASRLQLEIKKNFNTCA